MNGHKPFLVEKTLSRLDCIRLNNIYYTLCPAQHVEIQLRDL
jgi:hypothetical protein